MNTAQYNYPPYRSLPSPKASFFLKIHSTRLNNSNNSIFYLSKLVLTDDSIGECPQQGPEYVPQHLSCYPASKPGNKRFQRIHQSFVSGQDPL